MSKNLSATGNPRDTARVVLRDKHKKLNDHIITRRKSLSLKLVTSTFWKILKPGSGTTVIFLCLLVQNQKYLTIKTQT